MGQSRASALYHDTCDIRLEVKEQYNGLFKHFFPWVTMNPLWILSVSLIQSYHGAGTYPHPNGSDLQHTSYLPCWHHQCREPSDSTDGSSYLIYAFWFLKVVFKYSQLCITCTLLTIHRKVDSIYKQAIKCALKKHTQSSAYRQPTELKDTTAPSTLHCIAFTISVSRISSVPLEQSI